MTTKTTAELCTPENYAKAANLFRLARTALIGSGRNADDRYERKIYARDELAKELNISRDAAYKIVDRALS